MERVGPTTRNGHTVRVICIQIPIQESVFTVIHNAKLPIYACTQLNYLP